MPSFRTITGEDAAIDLYCKQIDDVIAVKRPLNSVPPDAIIHRKNDIFEWMEVTSVWQGEHKKKHKPFAKALNSPVSHGEVFHHHFENGYWKTLEMDLVYSIRKKDTNLIYQPFLEKYGKGTLILNLEDPYYGPDELKQINLSIDANSNWIHFGTILLHLSSIHELRGGMLHSCPARLIPVILNK